MLERRARLAFALPVLWLGLVGCSPKVDAPPHEPLASNTSDPMGDCNAVLSSFEGASQTHIEQCSDVSYPMSPPVFGNHYPVWAAYQTYDFPVPLGFLVHDLEHGAVVFFYDCPEGCQDEVAEVQSFIDALPPDPRCASHGIEHQVILVPRPELGARWAASAWGYSISADCFDADLFSDFYTEHVGNGPEDLCNQGAVLTSDPCL